MWSWICVSCLFVWLFYFSTKDPGQKPFAFKIGQGSVIKGRSLVSLCLIQITIFSFVFIQWKKISNGLTIGSCVLLKAMVMNSSSYLLSLFLPFMILVMWTWKPLILRWKEMKKILTISWCQCLFPYFSLHSALAFVAANSLDVGRLADLFWQFFFVDEIVHMLGSLGIFF